MLQPEEEFEVDRLTPVFSEKRQGESQCPAVPVLALADSEFAEEVHLACEVDGVQEVSKAAERAIRNYVIVSLFHVSVFEGPAAVAEALGRSLLHLVLGLLYVVFGCGRWILCCRYKRHMKRSRQRFEDSLLFLFAACTLALPAGAAVFVYRDLYDAWIEGRLRRSGQGKETWVLQDVPTLFGPLDAQRLTTFKQGQGFYSQVARGSMHEHRSLIPV